MDFKKFQAQFEQGKFYLFDCVYKINDIDEESSAKCYKASVIFYGSIARRCESEKDFLRYVCGLIFVPEDLLSKCYLQYKATIEDMEDYVYGGDGVLNTADIVNS